MASVFRSDVLWREADGAGHPRPRVQLAVEVDELDLARQVEAPAAQADGPVTPVGLERVREARPA